MTIDIVGKSKNLTVGFEGIFLLHLEREDQPVILSIRKKQLFLNSYKRVLTMVTDQDPAPVCLFSLRGQAWLPERKRYSRRSVGLQT